MTTLYRYKSNRKGEFKTQYRSGFEERIAQDLQSREVPMKYETLTIEYEVPVTIHKYTPDFLLENDIIIEAKGRLPLEDRKKLLFVKRFNPTLDIRILFQNARVKLYKGSRTTYGDWATKNGFKWAEGMVPQEWIDE